MNKKYSTSQVVRLLELHPDWVFSAGKNEELGEHRASGGLTSIVFEQILSSGKFGTVRPYLRSDWTRVKPVKVKRERVKVCSLPAGAQVSVRVGGKLFDAHIQDEPGWTLYAVKDK